MDRDGPGFLADLAIVWLTAVACVVAVDAIGLRFTRPWSTLLGIAAAAVIVFAVLWTYYRVYLDERPVLCSASRGRFVVLSVQLVLVGFVAGAFLGPADPRTQVAFSVVLVALALLAAYWAVYRRGDGRRPDSVSRPGCVRRLRRRLWIITSITAEGLPRPKTL